jgi:hypothetical protein
MRLPAIFMEGTMLENAPSALRPLRLSEILDQAIRLYRRNFFKFIGIMAMVLIPVHILLALTSLAMSASMFSEIGRGGNSGSLLVASMLGFFGSMVVTAIQFVLVGSLGYGPITRIAADQYLGRETGLFESYRRMDYSWLRLMILYSIFVAIGVVLIIWVMIPCVGWLTGPGAMMFLYATAPLIVPIAVLEKAGLGTALSRLWDLSRRRFWWLVGFAIVLAIFNRLIVVGPIYLVTWLVQLLGASQLGVEQLAILNSIVPTLVSLLGSLLYEPLQAVAFMLVYFDLRVRTEGLDLSLQAAASEGADVTDLSRLPATPQIKPWFGWEDAGNFAAISIFLIGLYFLLYGLIFGIMMLVMAMY